MFMGNHDRNARKPADDRSPNVGSELVGVEDVDPLSSQESIERDPLMDGKPAGPPQPEDLDTPRGGGYPVVQRSGRLAARANDDAVTLRDALRQLRRNALSPARDEVIDEHEDG
jgi:hypothetical protein